MVGNAGPFSRRPASAAPGACGAQRSRRIRRRAHPAGASVDRLADFCVATTRATARGNFIEDGDEFVGADAAAGDFPIHQATVCTHDEHGV